MNVNLILGDLTLNLLARVIQDSYAYVGKQLDVCRVTWS
jgi:hypothetical protein